MKVPQDQHPSQCSHLIELLRWRASHHANKRVFTFLEDGETQKTHLTFAELDKRAQSIAAQIQTLGPSRQPVLLLYPPGLEYIAAFFGCLYAGVIAVPAYPPRQNRSLERLRSLALNAQSHLALTTQDIYRKVESQRPSIPELHALQWWVTNRGETGETAVWTPPKVNRESIAFLQYTSGSTGDPKGVMLSHGNLLHNLNLIHEQFGTHSEASGVFWLPPYHDMGLIGALLQTVFCGGWSTLMAPVTFLQKPVRWLQALSDTKASMSGAPNFAYDLCVDQIDTNALENLDLSHWQVAFNGAEPIRPETLHRFSEKFDPCGFRSETFFPCYGMAESAVFVTGCQASQPPKVMAVDGKALQQNRVILSDTAVANSSVESHSSPPNNWVRLVSSGSVDSGQVVRIVDPEACVQCPEDQVGEIWVSGDSIAQGYWNRPELSEATFQARIKDVDAGPFLRTGDLGFVQNGELYVTGRLKDLIIIRGRNHYPQDIEHTVENSHNWLRSGSGAAFSVDVEGEERLVIVQEVKRQYLRKNLAEVIESIRTAVASHHDLQVHAVILLRTMGIPKTSSGKIQRHACRIGFQEGSFKSIHEYIESEPSESEPSESEPSESQDSKSRAPEPQAPVSSSDPTLEAPATQPSTPQITSSVIREWLKQQLSAKLNIPSSGIDIRKDFNSFGIDSATAVGISGELETWLRSEGATINLSPTLVYDYPTIAALAEGLAQRIQTQEGTNNQESERERETKNQPIAIVGIGLRFPEASGPEEFWELLRNGIDAIQEVPASRWKLEDYYDSTPNAPGKMNTRFGGFLQDVEQFDPQFFGISPREAASMDPQQRLLLEVTWEAFEDAGMDPFQLQGSQTGVFIGISGSEYSRLPFSNPHSITPYAGTGNALSIAANRISYVFDFQGPSVAMDTACSSSLVAVHHACNSLWLGESQLAIAGGANLLLFPEVTINFSQAGALSPDGRCQAFDASANGYVRSEGAGVILLKPLSQALADRDPIYAVIRGSAINQDGRSNGIMAPNGQAQERVLKEAYRKAGVSPGAVQYVETHGTGTLLGDPIEAHALGEVLALGRPEGQPCWIGSVKSNIGHLEAAAGIAGIIKTALSLKQREIPRSVHFSQPNPHIPFDRLPLNVVSEHQPWPESPTLLAGVSSFGFGGTNAHVVLEAAPIPESQGIVDDASQDKQPPYLLPLSAQSSSALGELVQSYEAWLEAETPLAVLPAIPSQNSSKRSPDQLLRDLCHSASLRRSHLDWRTALVFESWDDLHTQLKQWHTLGPAPEQVGHYIPGRHNKVVFVFSGQGPQWWPLPSELLQQQGIFGETLRQCDILLRAQEGWSLIEELSNATKSSRLDQPTYTQPALFAIQVALANLWKSLGVHPDAIVGHSMGEVAAAHIAGALSLEDALQVICQRGKVIEPVNGMGRVAFVELSMEATQSLIQQLDSPVSVAANNGPSSTVISGETNSVDAILDHLQQQEVFCRRVDSVAFAAHSPQMDNLRPKMETGLSSIQPKFAALPLVSTVTGDIIDGTGLNNSYWAKNLREPVLFSKAIVGLADADFQFFIEMSPHPVLSEAIRQNLRHVGKEGLALASRRRDELLQKTMLQSFGRLYQEGYPVDWKHVAPSGNPLRLPSYPWQKQRCWFVPSSSSNPQIGAFSAKPLSAVVLSAVTRESQKVPITIALERVPEQTRLLKQLTVVYIARAFQDLKLFATGQTEYSLQNLIQAGDIQPHYQHLIKHWADRLATAGLLKKSVKDTYAVVSDDALSSVELPSNLDSSFSNILFLLDYLRDCGSQLAAIVQGKVSPLETLFPEGSIQRAEDIYQHWVVAQYFNDMVRAAVEACWTTLPANRPLRILEIGAGTGGTTASVLPTLPLDRTIYHFTDLSDFFFIRAKEKFRDYPFVRYQTLNIEQSPETQGFEPHSFDVIVATNVLHATNNLRNTVRHVRQLLSTGGMLLLNEVTQHNPWMEISVGLIEGWQRFEDDLRDDIPLLTPQKWKHLLEEEGFERVVAHPQPDLPTEVLGQHVMVALTSATQSLETNSVSHSQTPFPSSFPTEPIDSNETNSDADALPEKSAIRAEVLQLPTTQRPTRLETYLKHQLAHALGLPVDQINSDQPIMNLGFDSLMAVELKNRLESELGVSVSVTTFLKSPNIVQLSQNLSDQLETVDSLTEREPEVAQDMDGTSQNSEQSIEFPLSSGQQALWFLYQLAPESAAYNVTFTARLSPEPDVDAFQQAFQYLVDRHPQLRVVFGLNRMDQAKQHVQEPQPLAFEVIDLPESTKTQLRHQMREVAFQPFDLTNGPLVRVRLFRHPTGSYLLLSFHHIIGDYWSFVLMMNDLHHLYPTLKAGQTPSLPPLQNNYLEFVNWQQGYLQTAASLQAWNYWKRQLSGRLPTMHWPFGKPRTNETGFQGSAYKFELPASLSQRLKALSQTEQVTAYTLFLAIYQTLLHRYSNHTDILVGAPTVGRSLPGFEKVVGYFVNSVIMRGDLSGNPRFCDFLKRLRPVVLESIRFADYPLSVLLEKLQPHRESGYQSIFQTQFVMEKAQNTDWQGSLLFVTGSPGGRLKIGDLELHSVEMDQMAEQVDITFLMEEVRGVYHGILSYNTDLFSAAEITRMGTHLQTLMQEVSNSPDTRLSDFLSPPKGESDPWLMATPSLNPSTPLAHVAHLLLQEPSIEDCALLSRTNQHQELETVAYVVTSKAFSPERLYAYLHRELTRNEQTDNLPLPTTYVQVSTIPYTFDGAIDQVALERLPVLDETITKAWEAQLSQQSDIDDVVVISQKAPVSQEHFHLSDLLPYWNPFENRTDLTSTTRDTDHEKTTPSSTKETSEDADSCQLTSTSYENPPAFSQGEVLQKPNDAPNNLAEALVRAARISPEKGVTFVTMEGAESFLSYPQLLEKAGSILEGLHERGLEPGDKLIFQFEHNEDFIPAFWSCMLGGFIPVPLGVAPSYHEVNNVIRKLHNAWILLDKPVILTGQDLAEDLRSLRKLLGLKDGFHVEVLDEIKHEDPSGPSPKPIQKNHWHPSQPDDIALLLLTSGSTGMPKAVQQSHRALLNRSASTDQINGFGPEEVSLNWMPLDHVGGLVMYHLKDVYTACQQIQIPTHFILQKPLRWLDYIDKFRATVTWAPNFAYGLINDHVEQANPSKWDLSSMRFMLNGGEAIVAKTARKFLKWLIPHQLPPTAIHPSWGMSETCSGVVFSDKLTLDLTTDEDPFVEVGIPIPEFSVRIVDHDDLLLKETEIGRIQVKGDPVTSGYFNNPEVNQEAFTKDGWFSTGDLGFLKNGALTITGRDKDVIIINGINFYSHEIESVVEELEGVEVSYTAAIAVRPPGFDTDDLAILFHTPLTQPEALQALFKQIRKKTFQTGASPTYLLPVPKDRIPKTSIGKIQRTVLKKSFEAGEFDDLLRDLDLMQGNANTLPKWFHRKVWYRKDLHSGFPLHGQGSPQPYLVFMDTWGMGEALIETLAPHSVIKVEAGSAFECLNTERYRINPKNPDDYHQLLKSFVGSGIHLQEIIHLWNFTETGVSISSLESLKEAQIPTVLSLLYLTQALAAIRDTEASFRLSVVSNHLHQVQSQDSVAWEKGTLIGLLKTISLELPWLLCRQIDLDTVSPPFQTNAQNIVREIQSTHKDPEVAYRNGLRWIAGLEAVDLENSPKQETPIQSNGFYMVTGGLGGLGAFICQMLVREYRIKLLVVGRSELPKREHWDDLLQQNTTLAKRVRNYLSIDKAISESDSDWKYVSVDVCDLEGLRNAIQEAEHQWQQPLSGIFHLAGEGNLKFHWTVLNHHQVLQETPETFEWMFRPKVYGTWALLKLLQMYPQADLVLFSSVNSLFGGATFSAYSAANSFLSAVADAHFQDRQNRIVCVSWTMWDDVGMSEGNPEYATEASQSQGFRILPKSQGWHSLKVILHHNEPQWLIGLDSHNARNRRMLFQVATEEKLWAYISSSQSETAFNQRIAEKFSQSVTDRFGVATDCSIVSLNELPRTPEGAIDFKALAELQHTAAASVVEYIAPRNEVERTLARIMQESLGLDQVGIHDSFFDLGAHSVLIAQIQNKLQNALDREVSVVDLFQYPTIASLAEHLSQSSEQPSYDKVSAMADRQRQAIKRRKQLAKQRAKRRTRI